MGWGAQSWVRITPEITWGTYNGAGTPLWVRLPGPNACTVRATPQRQIIRSADGGNRRRQVVAGKIAVAGNLSTLFYPTQAAVLFGLAMTLSSNDLGSFTLDFWDTIQVHRFLGAKINSLACNGSASQDYIPMSLGITAKSRTTTTLAQPADTVFPTEIPYEHIESLGLLSIGGVQTKYSTLGFTLKNFLDGTFDEAATITSLIYCGRDLDLSVRLQYVAATLRAALDAQTALTITSGWARTAGLATTLDLKTKSYVATVGDELPLDKAAYQTIGIQTFYDQAATTDFSFTVV
jgi:hypothetical protein